MLTEIKIITKDDQGQEYTYVANLRNHLSLSLIIDAATEFIKDQLNSTR
jgi:hypothetical protein